MYRIIIVYIHTRRTIIRCIVFYFDYDYNNKKIKIKDYLSKR